MAAGEPDIVQPTSQGSSTHRCPLHLLFRENFNSLVAKSNPIWIYTERVHCCFWGSILTFKFDPCTIREAMVVWESIALFLRFKFTIAGGHRPVRGGYYGLRCCSSDSSTTMAAAAAEAGIRSTTQTTWFSKTECHLMMITWSSVRPRGSQMVVWLNRKRKGFCDPFISHHCEEKKYICNFSTNTTSNHIAIAWYQSMSKCPLSN